MFPVLQTDGAQGACPMKGLFLFAVGQVGVFLGLQGQTFIQDEVRSRSRGERLELARLGSQQPGAEFQ